MTNKKKIAAAIAGVTNYIKTQEEAAFMQAAAITAPPTAQLPPMNLWGASGRATHMELRSLMQLKAFHGSKMR